MVGKNYMRHTTGSVYAVFDKPVRMWRGTTMAGIVQDEARHDPSRGFVGGYELETLALGLPFMAAFLNPGGWGRSFTTALDSYENMAGMWIVGEDMPQLTNGVTLSETKDQHGLPVANVHFDDHPNDVAMRNHAYKQGIAMYEAVGATRAFPTPPYPSTHNLGTNRMSEKPEDGVCQQMGPDPRHREPLRLGRLAVHHRRCGKPDADHRRPGDPPGRPHRPRDERGGDLNQVGPGKTLRGSANPCHAAMSVARRICQPSRTAGIGLDAPGDRLDQHRLATTSSCPACRLAQFAASSLPRQVIHPPSRQARFCSTGATQRNSDIPPGTCDQRQELDRGATICAQEPSAAPPSDSSAAPGSATVREPAPATRTAASDVIGRCTRIP